MAHDPAYFIRMAARTALRSCATGCRRLVVWPIFFIRHDFELRRFFDFWLIPLITNYFVSYRIEFLMRSTAIVKPPEPWNNARK